MNYSWLDLPDSTLKVRLDISLGKIKKLLEEQKPISLAECAKTAEAIRETIRQEKRSGFWGFLFQLIFGALIGIAPSSAVHPDHPDTRALEELANHLEERTRKAFSDSILFVKRLNHSVDLRPAVVRACYKQMHGFLYGRDRLDNMLLALSKECGISLIEENGRKLLSDVAEKDSLINPLKATIKEQIKKAETESTESTEK